MSWVDKSKKKLEMIDSLRTDEDKIRLLEEREAFVQDSIKKALSPVDKMIDKVGVLEEEDKQLLTKEYYHQLAVLNFQRNLLNNYNSVIDHFNSDLQSDINKMVGLLKTYKASGSDNAYTKALKIYNKYDATGTGTYEKSYISNGDFAGYKITSGDGNVSEAAISFLNDYSMSNKIGEGNGQDFSPSNSFSLKKYTIETPGGPLTIVLEVGNPITNIKSFESAVDGQREREGTPFHFNRSASKSANYNMQDNKYHTLVPFGGEQGSEALSFGKLGAISKKKEGEYWVYMPYISGTSDTSASQSRDAMTVGNDFLDVVTIFQSHVREAEKAYETNFKQFVNNFDILEESDIYQNLFYEPKVEPKSIGLGRHSLNKAWEDAQ